MEQEVAELWKCLLDIYERMRVREYFFDYVAKNYEAGVYKAKETRVVKTLPQAKKPPSKQSDEDLKLDEKVEQALQKAAGVWKGSAAKPIRAHSPAPRSKTLKSAAPPAEIVTVPPQVKFRIIVNSEVLGGYMSKKRGWRQRRGQALSRTRKAGEAAQAAQQSFFARLHSRRSQAAQVPALEACIVREIAIGPLATEILQILSDEEISESIRGAARLPRKDTHTIDEAAQTLRVAVLCGWLQQQVEELRDTTHRDALLSCLRWVETAPRTVSFGGNALRNEHTLLTRLKGLSDSEDAKKLVGLYRAAGMFQARRSVVECAAGLSEAAGLPCLRVIHSILRSEGSRLFTAVHKGE